MNQAKFSVIAYFFVLFACKTQAGLSEFNWFLGTWQINESRSFEEWTEVNDHLYRGKGYKIRKNDTIITETINIVRKGKDFFYIPAVKDQNDGKPIEFKLISKKKDKLVFENKNHDFPQRIIYERTETDRIEAKIEGVEEGIFSEVRFRLKKIN